MIASRFCKDSNCFYRAYCSCYCLRTAVVQSVMSSGSFRKHYFNRLESQARYMRCSLLWSCPRKRISPGTDLLDANLRLCAFTEYSSNIETLITYTTTRIVILVLRYGLAY